MKVCQIFYLIFEIFSSNFASIFSAIKNNYSILFVSSNILYFGQKWLIKVQIFEIFECSDENLPSPHVIFQTASKFFFQILHDSSASSKITFLYFFRLKIICFAQNGPIKVQILETFECLNQNSPKSCQFWKNKLLFFKFCMNRQYHKI